MRLEAANAHCPKCGSDRMYYLIGDDGYFQSVFQMKCINCNSYFTVAQVLGDKQMTAPPKQTNADRIRAMTDEELATIIFCGNPCVEQSFKTETELLDWLKQEAD